MKVELFEYLALFYLFIFNLGITLGQACHDTGKHLIFFWYQANRRTHSAFLSNAGFQNKGQIKGQCLEIASGCMCVSSNKDQHYEPTETFVFNLEESSLAMIETFDMGKSDRTLSSAWSTLYQCKTSQL